jgi:hypothetical protein
MSLITMVLFLPIKTAPDAGHIRASLSWPVDGGMHRGDGSICPAGCSSGGKAERSGKCDSSQLDLLCA